MELQRFDAVVLAGGAARRLSGIDKALLTVGDVTLLERVLAAVADAQRVIVVGPERRTSRPVEWTREEPPGGGPAAGLGAGLALVDGPVVAVLAVDVPFVARALVRRLVAECMEHDAALVGDGEGIPQPLVAAYRTDVLRHSLDVIDQLVGSALTPVLEGISYTVVDEPGAALDCDTWEDVELARQAGGKT